MAWVKVPPAHHPIFLAALPDDPRVETQKMFGGVAAKVNGNVFAGLFGKSTMIWLPEAERAKALALPGAGPFDPMGDGRARSDKVMLPEAMMKKPAELRRWIARAFAGAAALDAKSKKPKKKTPSDSGALFRAAAQATPDVTIGVACEGTALETTTYNAKKRAFLFLGAKVARLKLDESRAEAKKLGADVGAQGWVKIDLTKALAKAVVTRWVRESRRLIAG